jgi:hypothetical protein
MPSDYLKEVLSSGRAILGDTKTPKLKKQTKPSSVQESPESDPHKIFVKRAINEKPKKQDMVKEMERFIKAAEDAL